MVEKWTPEFEMEYVSGTTKDELMKRNRMHAEIFDFDEVVSSAGPGSVFLEVGCGAAGGLLSQVTGPLSMLVAVDPLAREYHAHYWMDRIKPIVGYASELPLMDKFADVVICLEALDHCDDMGDFRKSQSELVRVLKTYGTMLFMLPARSEARDGHPCCPSSKEVVDEFERLGMKVVRSSYPKEGTWLLLEKLT